MAKNTLTTLEKLYQLIKETFSYKYYFKIYFRVKHLIGFSEFSPSHENSLLFSICLFICSGQVSVSAIILLPATVIITTPVLTLSQSPSDNLVGKISSVLYALW